MEMNIQEAFENCDRSIKALLEEVLDLKGEVGRLTGAYNSYNLRNAVSKHGMEIQELKDKINKLEGGIN